MLLTLGIYYPQHAFVFQFLLSLDVSSHYIHMYRCGLLLHTDRYYSIEYKLFMESDCRGFTPFINFTGIRK